MPPTAVIFYQDPDGTAPVLERLRELRRTDPRAYAKCIARIERLGELGHQLRWPEADYLRDDIYELRARRGRLNYRVLYFFHGRAAAVLAHSLTKEKQVPPADIEIAINRRRQFLAHPKKHTYEEDPNHA